ncbi:hypothetical protein RYX36_015609 [Vicia faba]
MVFNYDRGWSYATNDYTMFAAILPLAVVHTFGNMLTNISLGKVSISFTHTIKAMEPFFIVVLSSLLLGEVTPN